LLRNFVAKLAAVAAASLLSVHAALLVNQFYSSCTRVIFHSVSAAVQTFVWHSERNWATKSRFHEREASRTEAL